MTASTTKVYQRFKIHVNDDVLKDLNRRLSATRWLDNPQRDSWSHGVNQDYLKEFVDYWRNSFDWRAQENYLNSLSHYTAKVDDSDMHFVYHKGEGSNCVPILLLHGWPDSFYRFHKILPLLTKGNGSMSFDVIIPSLPGFGFTKGPINLNAHQPLRQTTNKLFKLMTQVLGYSQFVAAGGDGGSPIAQLLAIDHPEQVKAIYLTDPGWHTQSIDEKELSYSEKQYARKGKAAFMENGSYAVQQTTKPMTLAYSLNDSPVALAAWILDRFHFWTDGDFTEVFTKDELLTNIMIYWVTETITPSMLQYKMEALSPTLTHKDYVPVPTGVGTFPKDLGGHPPKEFFERTANIKHYTAFDKGGHFTAWEQPDAMAEDMFKFFSTINIKS